MTPTLVRQLEAIGPLLPSGARDASIFLVIDGAVWEASGVAGRLLPMFESLTVRRFSDFESNPTLEAVARGIEQFGTKMDQTVVAIGGGTTIDLAKLIVGSATQLHLSGESSLSKVFDQSDSWFPRISPFFAIPTTAGTGSEATQFAVLYRGETKFSISHSSLIPDVVVLDESLIRTMPKHVAVASGFDLLSQAIESLWSVQATPASIELAEQALIRGLRHFEDNCFASTNDGRRGMLEAAHDAGRAINVSRTTAPHALSYALTIRFGIPHGLAVALSMPHWMRFNDHVSARDVADVRGLSYVQRTYGRIANAFGLDSTDSRPLHRVAEVWEKLMQRSMDQLRPSWTCGCRLADWGITNPSDLNWIAASVNRQRLANNPRVPTSSDVLEIVLAMA